MLERRLQVTPEQTRGKPGERIGRRHRDDVGARQHQAAQRADLAALADDDAGQDGDHREYAGRQCQQEAEAEEAREDGGKAVALQVGGDRIGFGQGGRGARNALGCRPPGVGRGARPGDEGQRLLDRGVTDAVLGAALVADLHIDGVGTVRQRQRRAEAHRLAQDLDNAEFRVVLGLARRQAQVTDHASRRQGLDAEFVAVEVVAGRDVPVQRQPPVGGRFVREDKGLVGRQEFASRRFAGVEGVEQPCGGDAPRQQQGA